MNKKFCQQQTTHNIQSRQSKSMFFLQMDLNECRFDACEYLDPWPESALMRWTDLEHLWWRASEFSMKEHNAAKLFKYLWKNRNISVCLWICIEMYIEGQSWVSNSCSLENVQKCFVKKSCKNHSSPSAVLTWHHISVKSPHQNSN